MKIAIYGSKTEEVGHVEELSWEDLLAKLSTPDAGQNKQGRAWAPIDTDGRRKEEHVRAVTVGAFDLDHLTEEQADATAHALDADGIAWAMHSTYSHAPPSDCRYRLLVKLDRPILPKEWAAFRKNVEARYKIAADPKAENIGRIFFFPVVRHGEAFEFFARPGRALAVGEFLQAIRIEKEAAPAASLDEVPVDVHDLAGRLKKYASEKSRDAVRRALAGEPLAAKGSQDATLQKLAGAAAFIIPEASDDVIVHLFGASFAATDWGEGLQHLISEFLKKLSRARERKAAEDKRRADEAEAHNAFAEAVGLLVKTKEVARGDIPFEEGAEDPETWGAGLRWKPRKSDKDPQFLEVHEANVAHVLTKSPEWRNVLRYNELTKELTCRNPPKGIALADSEGLDIDATTWFQTHPWYTALKFQPKSLMVENALRKVIRVSRFDPIKEYLGALTWDGEPRISELFVRYFKAEGDPRYLRAVAKKWMISLIARGLLTKSHVDTMLVLEGAQGIGKSRALRILGREFYTETALDLGNKDSAALMSKRWIVEWGELKDLGRHGAESVKAFLSTQEDDFRAPYARTSVKTPRRAVVVGTTNDSTYLKADESGYRRIWPVKCGEVDLEALEADRDQLFAEAVVCLQAGEKWHLDREEAALAEAQAEQRVEVDDGIAAQLQQWLLEQPPAKRDGLRADQFAVKALGIEVNRLRPTDLRNIGCALARLGFKRKRLSQAPRPWVYLAPLEILSAPVSGGVVVNTMPRPAAPTTVGTKEDS